MISDYRHELWGIETYIHTTAELLRSQGHEVLIIGSGIRSLLWRRMGLMMTLCNIPEALRIAYIIKKEKPDLIWRHSISRYLGRLPVLATWWSPATQWMMFHDLWYVYPYPSQLTDIGQIPHFTLKNWMQLGTHQMSKIAIFWKYMGLKMIRISLWKGVDRYLVPSDFMIPIIERWWIPRNRITTLAHWVKAKE